MFNSFAVLTASRDYYNIELRNKENSDIGTLSIYFEGDNVRLVLDELVDFSVELNIDSRSGIINLTNLNSRQTGSLTFDEDAQEWYFDDYMEEFRTIHQALLVLMLSIYSNVSEESGLVALAPRSRSSDSPSFTKEGSRGSCCLGPWVRGEGVAASKSLCCRKAHDDAAGKCSMSFAMAVVNI